MPLWDSVQRGLGKAQQEAARIAKGQKLRSTADGLSRQIYTQNNALMQRTMELFVAGQLTQAELLPLCQELANLQQQLNQVQNELKQLQAAQAPMPQTQADMPNIYPSQPPVGTGTGSYPQTGDVNPGGAYAPPPPPPPSSAYQAYFDSTDAFVTPPPPPGMGPGSATTISQMETISMGQGMQRCLVCHSEIYPNTAFCHVCGSPILPNASPNLPTIRAGTVDSFYAEEQATMRSDAASTYADLDATVRANPPVVPPVTPPAVPPPPPRSDSASDIIEQDKEV
jgi:hypothetical protein